MLRGFKPTAAPRWPATRPSTTSLHLHVHIYAHTHTHTHAHSVAISGETLTATFIRIRHLVKNLRAGRYGLQRRKFWPLRGRRNNSRGQLSLDSAGRRLVVCRTSWSQTRVWESLLTLVHSVTPSSRASDHPTSAPSCWTRRSLDLALRTPWNR